MGSYRQLTGMQKSPNRPDRVAPVPEKYQGTSVPYRGTNDHGVPIDKEAEFSEREYQIEEDKSKPVYLPAEKEVDPITVRVVQDSARERLDWRVVRFVVGDVAQQILGRLETRRSVTIRVHEVKSDGATANSSPIYIGNDNGLRPMTGERVPAGGIVDALRTTEDIWAVTDPGVQVEISIRYEFAVIL